MEYGVSLFFTDYSIGPVELGRAAEERGFDSLWTPEHSHIPVSRNSPFYHGGELPKKYFDVMDPFVTLSAVAAATKTIKIGTGICLIIQRDTIQTAKSVASLDQISNGRFLFGIGGGWNAEEMADHGTTDFKGRFKLMKEQVTAMREIWTKSTSEFSGTYVNFPAMMTWPKPVQKPYPPVIIGGAFPHAARRAIAYADGWIPHANRPEYGDGDIASKMPEFFEMVKSAGRDPAEVPVTAFNVPLDADLLKRYRDAGISRAVFALEPVSEEETLTKLDEVATTVREAGG